MAVKHQKVTKGPSDQPENDVGAPLVANDSLKGKNNLKTFEPWPDDTMPGPDIGDPVIVR